MNTSEQLGEISRMVEALLKRKGWQLSREALREAEIMAIWGNLALDRPGLTVEEVRAALKGETECST